MRHRISPRWLLRPTVAALACTLQLALPAAAGAIVSDPQAIDGPSADIIDVADAAMSEDGTGGVVYLKREEGRTHVFVAQ